VTSSTSECRFKCKLNYTWKNSQCIADTRTANCVGLPTGAVWNTVSSITQTWNGTDWSPSTTGTYNTTSSTKECRFKCNSGYIWNNSRCELTNCFSVTPCQDQNNHLFWSSKSSTTVSYSGALYYCNNLTEGGYNDWRLPTVNELRTLLINCPSTVSGGSCKLSDPGCLTTSCHSNCTACTQNDTGYYSRFKDTGYFWSSSPQTDTSGSYYWMVSFSNGSILTGSSGNYNVRCVRN
jgi:hypothetical protein